MAKATPSLTAAVQRSRIVARVTRAAVVVRVRAAGYTPTGVVRVVVAGRSYAARLVSGRAVVRVAPFRKAGYHLGVVGYSGDSRTLKASRYVTFRVVRR